jgi:hypothetical protein
MAMQYDVKQGHIDQSGYLVKFATRVKGVSYVGTATAGFVVLFDTLTTPVSASVTYGRSGNTVTVTKTAHGLNTGDVIGIHFESGTGGAATDGNYTITRTGADTFTLTDINTGTITATPAAIYSTKWILTYNVSAGDTYNNAPIIPGEGVRVNNGVYAYMSNVEAIQIYYG